MKHKAKLLFHRCLQGMQDIGTSDEFMVSRVFFSVQLTDRRIDGLFVDLKQTVSDDFETGTIEVGKPQGPAGNIDYRAFRDAVEQYYRRAVGSTGSAIKIVRGGSAIMRNNSIEFTATTDITIDTESGGW